MTQKLYHFDEFLDQMSWYKFMEYSACVPVFGLALAPKLLGQIFLKFHIGG
jgi:hypothetical protein